MKNLENKAKFAFKNDDNIELLIHEKIIEEFRDCMNLLSIKIGEDYYKQITLLQNNPQDDIF